MKIALINASEIEMAPYLKIYQDLFISKSVNYDIIEWRRNIQRGLKSQKNNIISYEKKASIKRCKILKFIDYIFFSNFVKRQIKENKYDRIIVFDYPLAFFLKCILVKNYEKKYIIDIRDYYSITKYIKRSIQILDTHAYARIISSEGYHSWLGPTDQEEICHNIPMSALSEFYESKSFNDNILKILTIGQLRSYNNDIKLVNCLSNRNVVFNFVGKGKDSSKFEKLSLINPYVHYYGLYNKEDEKSIARQYDLINITLDNNLSMNTAMSNRFYLSLICGLPMIVNKASIQAKYVQLYHLGVAITSFESASDELTSYINNYTQDEYNLGRKAMIASIKSDNDKFEHLIERFLNSI